MLSKQEEMLLKPEETEIPNRTDYCGNKIQRRRALALLMVFIFGSSFIVMDLKEVTLRMTNASGFNKSE